MTSDMEGFVSTDLWKIDLRTYGPNVFGMLIIIIGNVFKACLKPRQVRNIFTPNDSMNPYFIAQCRNHAQCGPG